MKIMLIVYLLFTASLMFGSSSVILKTWTAKALNKFGQSKCIDLYSRYVQTKIDKIGSYGHELAPEEYQKLGAQAQTALGIKPELQLPIKKIKGESLKMVAVAGSDGIYVNSKIFDQMSFGAQRCTMFHESVHAKYHDASVIGIFKIVGLIVGCAGMHELLTVCDVVMLHKSLTVLSGVIGSFGLSWKYRQFMERRADIQGHQAVNCELCVQEMIQDRTDKFESVSKAVYKNMSEGQKKKTDEAMQKHYPNQDPSEIIENFECMQGYLKRSELKQIADGQKDQRCTMHQHS